jgi:hypothetical protein
MAREKALDIMGIKTMAPRKHTIIGQCPLPAGEFSHVESLATVIKL